MIRKRKAAQNGGLPSQEELLADFARRLKVHRKDRRAVHLHLSRLSRERLNSHDLRQAVEAFNPLIRKYEGRLFRLANHDIIFTAKDLTLAALDEAVLRVRHIFRDDPVYRTLDARARSPQGSDAFCTFYDIEREAEAFMALAERILEDLPDEDAPDSSVIPFAAVPPKPAAPAAPAKPSVAQHVDIHSVCALTRDGTATPILSELHVRIDSLKVLVRTARPLPNDRFLLRALAELIDEDTVGSLIARNPLPTAFSLPLHPETVQSSEFLDFTDAYRRVARGGVVFEFTCQDMMREPAQFLAARDRVTGLGHKVCLTGWDPHLFAMLNPRQLEVHFHKISWTPLLIGDFRRDWGAALAETVRGTGATKVILTDCGSAEAVAFGQRHGLLLFQGPHIEATARG